jgi:hypothetical protein
MFHFLFRLPLVTGSSGGLVFVGLVLLLSFFRLSPELFSASGFLFIGLVRHYVG